jgi:multiple sugar transport system substrate-binding protein
MGVFSQGKAAFYTDANSIYKNAIDPDKSTIGDKVGYALFPGGKAGSKPYNITSWALAMNAKAVNKDAAWAFIQWASGKDVVLQTQQNGNPGVRASVWDNPEGVSGFPKDMVPVIKDSIKNGVGHDRPLIISVGEARDVIGDIVVKAMLGQDIQVSADKANQDFQALIDKDKTK